MSDVKWDENALLPEKVVIPFPDGKKITFTELSRSNLFKFMDEATKVNIYEEAMVPNSNFNPLEAESDNNPKEVKGYKRKGTDAITEEAFPVLYKYLALATDGQVEAEYFEKLDLPFRKWGVLVNMIYDLCHVDDFLVSNGNPFVLPQIMRQDLKEATSQETTSQE